MVHKATSYIVNAANVLYGTVDPSAAAGVAAPVGSVYYRNVGGTNTAGELWIKIAATDTDWSQIEPLLEPADFSAVGEVATGYSFLGSAVFRQQFANNIANGLVLLAGVDDILDLRGFFTVGGVKNLLPYSDGTDYVTIAVDGTAQLVLSSTVGLAGNPFTLVAYYTKV